MKAASLLFRKKGLAATTVQEICDEAGMTKGAFFHHFRTKHEVALAAVDQYTDDILARLPVRGMSPEERLSSFFDQMGRLMRSKECTPACLIAVYVVELGAVREDFRVRCAAQLARIGDHVEPLIAAVANKVGAAHVDPRSLAEHLVATLQGALILARAENDTAPIGRALTHFQIYLAALLVPPAEA